MWKNFTTHEVLNPLFGDCPVKTWIGLPGEVRQNLLHTMELVQALRDYIAFPIRINSAYRLSNMVSAHAFGKAIDCQFIDGDQSSYIRSMWWFKEGCSFSGYRVIMEWSGREDGIPWFHIDRNHKDNGKRLLYVGYPEGGNMGSRMLFTNWFGGLPRDYL